MKKALLIIVALMLAGMARAQDILEYQGTRNGDTTSTWEPELKQEYPQNVQYINDDRQYFYIEIVGWSNFGGNKVSSIQIDFGQEKGFGEDTRLRDGFGKVRKFNSMIAVMNWLGRYGWEFQQAYAVSIGNNQHVYHYLMRIDIAKLTHEELLMLNSGTFPNWN